MSEWKRLSEIVRVGSQWVTLVGERWLCDEGKELEYWRVEKVDSVIVLPLQGKQAFCTVPTFRPGAGRATLDFPGGRLPEGMAPQEIVPALLQRELGIAPTGIQSVTALSSEKWLINSSFSNQGLWPFMAEINETFEIPKDRIGAAMNVEGEGADELLAVLDCLQCRAVFLEWQRSKERWGAANGSPNL